MWSNRRRSWRYDRPSSSVSVIPKPARASVSSISGIADPSQALADRRTGADIGQALFGAPAVLLEVEDDQGFDRTALVNIEVPYG